MTAIACALFAPPPFPGASPAAMVRAGPADAAHGATADQLIAAFRAHKVGGAFWQYAAGPGLVADPWSDTPAPHPLRAGDPQALLAAIAGQSMRVEGEGPFAALADIAPASPEMEALLRVLVQRHLLTDIRYHDPFTGEPTSPLALLAILARWRDLIEANRSLTAAFGFAHWKRDTVDPLLWGGRAVPFLPARMSELDRLAPDTAIAVWKARVSPDFLDRLEHGPWRIVEVEDGFIRSAGLGADCVPPLSIVVDDLGVHYDPLRPSRLEQMLATSRFSQAELNRARQLRDWLVSAGISKYGMASDAALPRPGGGRRHILVTGQVEDDRSMQFGGGAVRTNLALLKKVRESDPRAWIIYRPHPDVEAGHRRGAIPPQTVLHYADSIDAESPISALIAMIDEVHVITSLAGFEALLHGKAVTTHGTPFFAGWGLTRDLGAPPPRRGVMRTLDELVAAVLLRYPRYLDPVTNLPATAEILVMRLLSGVQRQNNALVPLRRLVGRAKRALAHLVGIR
ncbi:MAG: hypothetical protein BGP16_06805 [Sphingobium sp. 66-54]|mgnify:CR=1 FL=1|nr:MAG: hypothetical protein BGP16_06805 [Sphingobium sp. 66-54]